MDDLLIKTKATTGDDNENRGSIRQGQAAVRHPGCLERKMRIKKILG
jgi:hypothetical protein